MSRVIKFRAWHKKDNWMESGVDFYIRADGVIFEPAKHTYDTPNSEIESSDDFILMQFTGLHDVNGVEIYEGDIVEVFSDDEFAFNHEVKWHDEHGCYCIDAIHGCDYDYTTMPWAMYSQYYSYKVIGNIHQNQELLECNP